MGMQEGSKANGWYNEYNINLMRNNNCDIDTVKEIVRDDMSESIDRFVKDKKYFIEFTIILKNYESAAKAMKETLGQLKNMTIFEPVITIKSVLKEENMEDMNRLADAVCEYNK